MQTQPHPPAESTENDHEADISRPLSSGASSLPVYLRLLNIGLALATVGLAFIYVSKGWSGYSWLPGGRKLAFGLGGVVWLGLAAGRFWWGPERPRLLRFPAIAWQDTRVREALPVGLLVGLALAVRVWGVNFGLPYLEHVDEWNVAERAIHIVQIGSFDPYDYLQPGLADNDRQAFTYPTLYTYLETGVFAARFLQGVTAGQYDGTSILASSTVKPDFYLWGRALTALLGAGTVLLLYLLGKRVYGRAVGLVAALFLTFFYLHALNSHWITTDVPSGFMALLPFFWIVPIAEGRDSRKTYLLAGLLAGLAVATKYNNALILVPLVMAHLLGRPPRRWVNWNLPLALGASFAGFFAGAPFIFFHSPQFLTDLAAIINHYQNIGHPGYESNDNWLQYIQFMLNENVAVVWLGLAGVGLVAARHTRNDLILLAFPLLTYLQLSSYKVNFSRNLMPVIPFLALFAAFFLVAAVRWLGGVFQSKIGDRKSRIADWMPAHLWSRSKIENLAIGVVGVLAVISPAVTILQYDNYNAQPTNRARATAWIEQNLPAGAKIWLEPLSTDLLPHNRYRLEGGKGVLANPPEWYAANGYHYIVLSEAYYKEAAESGNESVRAAYKAYTEGPYPAGMTLAQDFKKNNTDRPGARIIVLSTGLPLLTSLEEVAKIARPLDFSFGNELRLIGWKMPETITAGQQIMVNLYWQTQRQPGQNYTTFLHLLDAKDNIVAQIDLAPLAGTRPTTIWKTGEVVADDYPLTLPPKLAPGAYRLSVGLYLAPNGPRLTLPGGKTEAVIGSLEVK